MTPYKSFIRTSAARLTEGFINGNVGVAVSERRSQALVYMRIPKMSADLIEERAEASGRTFQAELERLVISGVLYPEPAEPGPLADHPKLFDQETA